MTYLKYNTENKHDQVCEFEEFSVGRRATCGQAAIGQREGKKTVMPLCHLHFGYCRSIDKVMKVEVIHEEKKEAQRSNLP